MDSKFVQIESEDLMMIEGGADWIGKLTGFFGIFDYAFKFGKWLGRKTTVTVY